MSVTSTITKPFLPYSARRKRRTTVQGNEKKTSLDVPAEMKVTEANLNITAIRDTVKGQIVNSRLAVRVNSSQKASLRKKKLGI